MADQQNMAEMFAKASGSKLVDESQEQTQIQEEAVEQQTETQAPQQEEQSSLNTENQVPESPKEDLLTSFNEKFETKYSSFDEVKNALNKPAEVQNNFASEEIAKINEFVTKTGRGVNDFYKAYGSNYDEMSEADIVRESLKINNPDLSEKEVDLYFRSTYKIDEGKNSEDEVTLAKINLKRDAAKARKELKEMQESFKGASENYTSPEDSQKMRETWLNNLQEEVNDLEGVAFELDDKGNEFTYTLTDEDKKNLYDNNSSLNNFFERYLDGETKEWNLEKLNIEMFILDNFDKIIRSVASQNKSVGKEQIIKDIKNPSIGVQKQPTETRQQSMQSQIFNELYGK